MGRGRRLRPLGDLRDPRGFGATAQAYFEWLREHRYSEETLFTWVHYLRRFFGWCEERGVTRPDEVTRAMLERYQRWVFYWRKRDGQPLGIHAQQTAVVAVRSYFKWLARNHHLLHNPASELTLPRLGQRLPKVLTLAEVEAVLAQAEPKDALRLRDRTILETLYSTAMRRMELCRLRVDDVDAERGIVSIRRGKGDKDRVVPIGQRALKWLDRYLCDARPHLVVPPDEGTLFLLQNGKPFLVNYLSQLVHGYVKAAGLTKPGACHLLRHTAATLMLEHGADVRYIQEMLGHERLTTTQIYTQVSIRKLKQVHTKTHPGAKLERRGREALAQDADSEG